MVGARFEDFRFLALPLMRHRYVSIYQASNIAVGLNSHYTAQLV